MNKKAFTLIELLVVIAIIAILAAILFPVFAQAKQAAKKTASLSNIKQVGLAALMYGGDADDGLPLMHNGPYAKFVQYDGVTRVDSWVWQVQPYIKSLALMKDPMHSDSDNIFGSGPYAWFQNQNFFPQFGYNYIFLSPWNACDVAEGRSATGVTEPANTVMFTQSRAGDTSYTNNLGYYTTTAPGMYPTILNSATYCIWTDASWAKKNPLSTSLPATAEAAMRDGSGTNVNWVDGHAKYMKAEALAAGTDYSTSAAPNSTVITDKNAYLWNYDDNYFEGS